MMDEKTFKNIAGIADVCVAENGLVYTGQAAEAIQRCWSAMDFIKQCRNVEETINAIETR